MELKEWPETELGYWGIIESLGGFLWRMNHDAADGRFEITPAMEKDLLDAQKIQKKLVSELFVLFGVIPPENMPRVEFGEKRPAAPFGCIWYWDWYEKMQEEFYRSEYEKIICSACPFSKGVESFCSARGRGYPCSIIRGTAGIINDKVCGMVAWKDWSVEQLFEKLAKKGDKALKNFRAKQVALDQAA